MNRGFIVPIGGAEEKIRDQAILRRFAKVAGGRHARIAVIPTASQLRETGRNYVRLFEDDLGVHEARSLSYEQRGDAANDDWFRFLERATGVFFTGGNQLRLSTTIGGTRITQLIRSRNQDEELHVAGTSAGASFLSEHMIAHGEEGVTPRADKVQLSPGMGLTQHAIIDQHFMQRDRIGRLLSAVAYNPRLLGIGLDEDTAAFMDPDDRIEVVGTGAVTILDGAQVEYTSLDSAEQHAPVAVIGMKLHVLTQGATFDIRTRQAHPPPRR